MWQHQTFLILCILDSCLSLTWELGLGATESELEPSKWEPGPFRHSVFALGIWRRLQLIIPYQTPFRNLQCLICLLPWKRLLAYAQHLISVWFVPLPFHINKQPRWLSHREQPQLGERVLPPALPLGQGPAGLQRSPTRQGAREGPGGAGAAAWHRAAGCSRLSLPISCCCRFTGLANKRGQVCLCGVAAAPNRSDRHLPT